MLMLHQHITRALLTLFLSTLLLSGLVSYFTIKNSNIEKYQQELESHIQIIKLQLPLNNNLENFAKAIKEKTGIRFTLIASDGNVIIDSDFDHENMNNHAHREEIVKAQKSEYGSSVRYSQTLKMDFLYVAHHIKVDDEILFLRLSSSLEGMMHNFYDLWIKMALIFGSSILFGLYGAYVLSKKIRLEIDKIIANLQQIADKDYKISLSSHFSFEFFEISNFLKKLASKLEKRAKQKRKYTAKIKLISQQRSDVISAISHEFKNPIASIMGYAQTLLDDGDANAQIRERFLGKIIQNGQKISGMIDRLALTTKFENGDFTSQNSEFDMGKLTQDIVQTFREKNQERVIVCDVEENIISADKTMMEIVLSNLIDNALKYSEEALHVSIKDKVLHVKDSGQGIKAEDIEKVTQKFFRSSTHSWDNSMGLGLALVSYILKLHNTNLEIQSTLGEGSDFSFKLP
ncbi:MAG: sensor histidine kinase [Campylobacteraceae bacterium]|nr:sensor histidine kinase [Campylobacteraceae bacterium]